MPSFSDWLFGSPDKLKKVATGTPQQNAAANTALGQYGNQLQQQQQMTQPGGGYDLSQNYYNQLLQPGAEGFDQFSEPYLKNFMEQMLPRIAEQYAGSGALSSSGFGQSLGGAASGLQGQLAQLFSQLQQNAAGAQTNQYNQLGQSANQSAQIGLGFQPFGYQQKQGSGGVLGPLAIGLGGALGGPLGGALAGGISSLFKKPQSSSQGGIAGNSANIAGLLQMMGGQ